MEKAKRNSIVMTNVWFTLAWILLLIIFFPLAFVVIIWQVVWNLRQAEADLEEDVTQKTPVIYTKQQLGAQMEERKELEEMGYSYTEAREIIEGKFPRYKD